MDTEPKTSSLPPQRDTKPSVESPEVLFRRTLGTTRKALGALSVFAQEHGVEREKIAHIDGVFTEDSHILLPSIDTMRSKLAEMRGESDRTRRTRALLSRKTGQVFVPKEQVASEHDVLHESIHRAEWLYDQKQGISQFQTTLINQLAERYAVRITPEGRIDPESSYIQEMARTDEDRKELIKYFKETLRREDFVITEGLTEWTTQRANGLHALDGSLVHVAESDSGYPDEVGYINEVKARMLDKEGISDEQADACLIAAALTGDINRLSPYLETVPLTYNAFLASKA